MVSLLVSVLVGLAFRKPLLRIYFSPIRRVPGSFFFLLLQVSVVLKSLFQLGAENK